MQISPRSSSTVAPSSLSCTTSIMSAASLARPEAISLRIAASCCASPTCEVCALLGGTASVHELSVQSLQSCELSEAQPLRLARLLGLSVCRSVCLFAAPALASRRDNTSANKSSDSSRCATAFGIAVFCKAVALSAAAAAAILAVHFPRTAGHDKRGSCASDTILTT